MTKKLNKFQEYLKNTLNYHVDNDNEAEMLAIQDVIMEFTSIFGPKEASEANS